MNELELTILSEQKGFDPGVEVSVRVGWKFDETPDALELRLVWNTSGKGDRDLKVVQVVEISPSSPTGSHEVMLTLPWGPYSFSGKLLSIVWALELVAFPNNESLRREIVLAPNGEEVVV
ncbi:hypothetical protein KOR42_37730 [Thalassoglobus neptunius]|uniref:Uncharacterized protein n=1 Tax=Thalassoglobus neptunius TaxID=1938619 RepID=A0A5C5WIM9_9PLAN|nr:hypothetical protein [Thalassoglobus neptunius]TWT49955.1 hypothetical protein KOR42_37730 [Thalassoglobus neptunius]